MTYRFYALELCSANLEQLFLGYHDPMRYNGPRLPPFDVLLQLAEGLEHIHLKGLTHRDIKPANVLLHVGMVGNQPFVTMKWADFGLSKTVNARGTFTVSGIRGTICWTAPEVLAAEVAINAGNNNNANNPNDVPRGNVKSDVFAAGLLFFYFLLDGVHPYGRTQVDIPSNILNNRPENLAGELIYGQLLQSKYVRRPITSFAKIIIASVNYDYIMGIGILQKNLSN